MGLDHAILEGVDLDTAMSNTPPKYGGAGRQPDVPNRAGGPVRSLETIQPPLSPSLILDSLLGRQKPVPVGPERLFAMSTAEITLQTAQNLTPSGTAAMCFKGVASGPFAQIQSELDQMLKVAAKNDSTLKYRTFKDDFGYSWLKIGRAHV